ncbi:MAG: glycosyltransferase [Bacteroidia bacterium]
MLVNKFCTAASGIEVVLPCKVKDSFLGHHRIMTFDLQLFWPLMLLALPALGSLFYYYRFWLPVLRYRDKKAAFNAQQEAVSVIIWSRNQADMLRKNLAAVLEQDYPQFEVVVVNDCSFDESTDVLMDFQLRYPLLRVVTVDEQPKYPTGKKFALTLGIKAATHNVLLFADADCRPLTNQWLKLMQQQYIDKTELVLGFATAAVAPGFANALSRFDALYYGLQTYGHALSRRAIMGNGRNLSYLRALFFFHKGFVTHIKHHSGEADLFVNQAANAQNVRVCMEPEAITEATETAGFAALWKRKVWELSARKFYRAADKGWLNFYNRMSWLGLLLLPLALWFYQSEPLLLYSSIGIVLLPFLHKLLFLALFSKKLKLKQSVALVFLAPVYQFLAIFWTLKAKTIKSGNNG